MTPKKEHYYRALRQKQDCLARVAGRLGASELEEAYLALSRAKQGFLEIVRSKLSPAALQEQAILFCGGLPAALEPVFSEMCRFAVDHAIDDFGGREFSLIQDIDSDIDEPSDLSLQNAYRAVSAESRVVSLGHFATRLELALKQGLDEHNGLDLELCLMMIGRRINSFLANLRRIVFTEICSAYNFTQLLCYDDVFRRNKKFMIRWCERIDDETGQPRHGTVSKDSIALHGQITRPRDFFYDDNNGRWFHPPNRPFDHAVMMFWHPALSAVPAWKHVKKENKNAARP